MRIISRSRLRQFWGDRRYRDSEQPLKSWYHEAKKSRWKRPGDIKGLYRHASFLANNKVVFNIHGNKYRLVVAVNYDFETCYIRFIGTHEQYDNIDAENI